MKYGNGSITGMVLPMLAFMIGMGVCVNAAHAVPRTVLAITARSAADENPSCYEWFDPAGNGPVGLARECGGSSYVDIAIPLDTAGSKIVSVWAKKDALNKTLSCQSFVITKTGGYIPSIVKQLTVASSSYTAIVFPAVNVPAEASIFVRCSMYQTTSILSVTVDVP